MDFVLKRQPVRPEGVIICRGCHKRRLTVDVGVTLEGHPAAWARCNPDRGGCGAVTCGMGRHVLSAPGVWEDGRTAKGGQRVPVCAGAGPCLNLFRQIEKAQTEFMAPGGAEAVELAEQFAARAKHGSEKSWVTQSALYMVEFYQFMRGEKARSDKRRMELVSAEVAPEPVAAHVASGLSYTEWEARERAVKAERREASARSEVLIREALDRGASMEEVAAIMVGA